MMLMHSQLIIYLNMMLGKPKTGSIKASSLKQKQNEFPSSNNLSQWYIQLYKHKSNFHKPPSQIPLYKESHPYRLIITKIQGLAITKKTSTNEIYLNLSGLFFTQNMQIIGSPFYYQFQQPMKGDSKWQIPVALYFHSKIDKNYESVYLSIKIKAIEVRDNFVENVVDVGVIIIKNILIEEENKVLPVFKDIQEIQFGYLPIQAKNKMLAGTSSVTAQYTLESLIQLKKIIRLVPQNMFFTHQNCISGLHNGYLPKQIEQVQINEAQSLQITVTFLQIQVSQKFQLEVINYLKKIYPNQKSIQTKNRKIVMGYHSQLQLINPTSKKIQLIDKEIIGQTRILIYQALKEGETIKLSFYNQEDMSIGAIVVGVIYQIAGRELEVACYYFTPVPKAQEISEKMLIGGGYGAMYQMLPLTTTEAPTLMLQYRSEVKQFQNTFRENELSNLKENRGGKQFVDQEQLKKEREKMMEEIEREKLEMLREKEEMEKLKNQNQIGFQAEFQRKFQIQKENLYKRQQMLETQYREQVEREIRQKFELEEEIKRMNDKLKNLEESNFKKYSGDASYQSSGREENVIRSPIEPQSEMLGNIPIRERLDPGYAIQPQNIIPVKKVREIIDNGPKLNQDLIKLSQQQMNYASKFTFSFISMIWSNNITPPKNIYLILRFFNQQPFTTDTLSYIQNNTTGYHQLIRMTHFIQGHQNKQPSYSFVIDPSEYTDTALIQRDLINYLVYHSAIIDVFCGETHLYIGQINVKLRELVRGNKTQTLIAKQLNLVKLKDKEALGVMQLLIKNEQINCKDQVSLKYQKKVKDIKKKIVSNNPIFITPEEKFNANTTKTQNYAEPIRKRPTNVTRQQLRIQKYKQQKANSKFALSANTFTDLGQSQKAVALDQIKSFKQNKIHQYIKGIYQGLLNQKITIHAQYGNAVTFPFSFYNQSQTPSSYKISFMNIGDENGKELTVIKSNKEWRYLVGTKHYVEPKRYDMIGQNNTFFLQPGEGIPLIFKYLTFPSNTPNQHIKQQVINVTICKQDNNWIAGGFSLIVLMHEQIIHHSYILYEPGEHIVDLIVPVIYSDTENTTTPKKLYITDMHYNGSAQWLNPYQILVRITTPKIMEKIKFNLLLYNDEYFCELKQNWLIEVHAYEGVNTTFRNDFNTRFKISLPCSTIPGYLGLLSLDKSASSLKLFASSSGVVFKNNTIDLEDQRNEKGAYQIWCELIGSENTRRNFQITCVSGEEDELLYGWVVTVYPYMPRN